MSDPAISEAASAPLLPLPGFLPDAVGFAFRLTVAMLLAYLVSFTVNLQSASSAGVCVAIVMQPSSGMTMSKALYRILGTVVGGAMALVIIGLFPQDRTLLLTAVALWLGACTYMASLLRDFRSYGAVLAGYTVAIIAVGSIDDPSNALVTTLDRVAAILIGIGSVALLNAIFVVDTDHAQLASGLRRHLGEVKQIALTALAGEWTLGDDEFVRHGSEILGLRTQAAYASAEMAGGVRRRTAAEATIAALLAMLAASRIMGTAVAGSGAVRPAPEARAVLASVAASLRGTPAAPVPDWWPATPFDALLVERAAAIAAECETARVGLREVEGGEPCGLPRQARLGSDPDRIAALHNAVRTMVAVALASVFCVLGNDSGVSLLLVQLAAFTALLSLQPNPTAAAATFGPPLPAAAAVAGMIAFLALPQSSGFVPFALAVGPGIFVLAVASRHPRLVPYGPALLLYTVLLLAPSNTESFDLSGFLNTLMQLILASAFTSLTFVLILPVVPRRRAFRIASKVVNALRHTVRHGDTPAGTAQLRAFDRLAQARTWIGAAHPGRVAVLGRLCDFEQLTAALHRASSGLREAGLDFPAADRSGSAALDRAAQAALASPAGQAGAVTAASGLYAAKLLFERQHRALRAYGVLDA